MGRGLAIVGILGSVAAALAMLVLVDAATFLVLPVILAGSIVLVMQRTVGGAVAGLLVLALAVVAALGLAGSVTTEGGQTDFGFSAESGRLLAVIGCLSLPAAAIAVRWHWIEPQPLAYVGVFCVAVSLLLAIARKDSLADQSDLLTVASGLVPLGAIASMAGLWRGTPEGDEGLSPPAVLPPQPPAP